MMHEIDESDLSFQGKHTKSYYGLLAWNVVHVFVAVVAGLVALSTSQWIGKSRVFCLPKPIYTIIS